MFNKYKLKLSFLKDNEEVQSFHYKIFNNNIIDVLFRLSENYNNPFSNIAEGVVNAENSASGMMAKFRNNKMVSGTKEFLEFEHSLVAKVCFLMLIIILFILGVRFGSRLLTWILSPSKNPILIDGLRDAQKATSISQDPSSKGSIPILRSVNEREGIEFSWSVWLFIKDTTCLHVMTKKTYF